MFIKSFDDCSKIFLFSQDYNKSDMLCSTIYCIYNDSPYSFFVFQSENISKVKDVCDGDEYTKQIKRAKKLLRFILIGLGKVRCFAFDVSTSVYPFFSFSSCKWALIRYSLIFYFLFLHFISKVSTTLNSVLVLPKTTQATVTLFFVTNYLT